MCTVMSVIEQLTAPEVVLQRVSELLRKIDPSFSEEERKYFHAVDALEVAIDDTVSPSVSEYIAAEERKISAELIYTAWLGIQQNLECFHNPINALFLKTDYEDFHRERRMHMLPAVNEANQVINDFHKAMRSLPEETLEITNRISEYICYLETTGYKIAHYFGFIFADEFFSHVIPGYCRDDVTTMQYTWDLQKCLQLDLDNLH